jgi:hypothetical protein
LARAGWLNVKNTPAVLEEIPTASVDRSDLAALERRLSDRLEEVSALADEGFSRLAAGIEDVARRLPGEDPRDTAEGQ